MSELGGGPGSVVQEEHSGIRSAAVQVLQDMM